jgi:hypothetical protein
VNEMSEITARWTVGLFVVKYLGNVCLTVFAYRNIITWRKPENYL